MDQLVPEDATLEECLAIHSALYRIKSKILQGHPSGQIIDKAIEQSISVGLRGNSQ